MSITLFINWIHWFCVSVLYLIKPSTVTSTQTQITRIPLNQALGPSALHFSHLLPVCPPSMQCSSSSHYAHLLHQTSAAPHPVQNLFRQITHTNSFH
ncbi:hypothetical protein AAHE18_19G232100 [Arachis hypogaea]